MANYGYWDWIKVEGTLKQVSVGLISSTLLPYSPVWNVWGVNDQGVFNWPPNITQPLNLWMPQPSPSQGQLVQVSIWPRPSEIYPIPQIWGLNSNDEIFRWTGNGGDEWSRLEDI